MTQIEYVPVPPPLELDPLPLPEPLPEEDDIDDPLDFPLDPDEDPLLDDPLPEPDPDPEPLELNPEPDECAVAGRSLWVHTPSAE